MDFDLFCVFVIVIVIDGSEKRPVVKATFELQSSCVFEKGSNIGVSKNYMEKEFKQHNLRFISS